MTKSDSSSRGASHSWTELLRLPVVRSTAQLFARHWNMGIGYADLGSREVKPPGTLDSPRVDNLCRLVQASESGLQACRDIGPSVFARLDELSRSRQPQSRAFTVECHAGIRELVAPVLIAGEIAGALLAGGFACPPEPRSMEPFGHSAPEQTRTRARSLDVAAAALDKAEPRLPWFDERELGFARTLLEAAAEAISEVTEPKQKTRKRRPRNQDTRQSYHGIIGASAPMQELFGVLDRVVRSDATVLIQGENGTGKELVARAIHYGSQRAKRRFVITNCSAFNDNLLDSELFGHKKGAFTGAFADKKGLFEAAHTGTFFLDEIGDMSPSLQVKVLRVLQEGTFLPVGDTETRKVDVRIIAATNRDLKAMVADSSFREDLYYRINVINLRIPPLRERREDIELLTEHFLQKHLEKSRRPKKTLTRGCIFQLQQYNWPGNVRELENEIERLIVLAGDATEIDEQLLSPRIHQHVPRVDVAVAPEAVSRSLPRSLRSLERRMLLDALERHDWNKTRAAAELEISRRNLIRLVQKYELEAHRPK